MKKILKQNEKNVINHIPKLICSLISLKVRFITHKSKQWGSGSFLGVVCQGCQ